MRIPPRTDGNESKSFEYIQSTNSNFVGAKDNVLYDIIYSLLAH